MHLTRSQTIKIKTPLQMPTAAFGHRPTLLTGAVQGNIDGAVVLWVDRVGTPFGPSECTSVIRRENTSDKDNDGDAVLPAVAYAIDIPPEITTRRDDLVESRSAIRQAAANRPDRAAMGTPAPGWTVPPAR